MKFKVAYNTEKNRYRDKHGNWKEKERETEAEKDKERRKLANT